MKATQGFDSQLNTKSEKTDLGPCRMRCIGLETVGEMPEKSYSFDGFEHICSHCKLFYFAGGKGNKFCTSGETAERNKYHIVHSDMFDVIQVQTFEKLQLYSDLHLGTTQTWKCLFN